MNDDVYNDRYNKRLLSLQYDERVIIHFLKLCWKLLGPSSSVILNDNKLRLVLQYILMKA